MVLKQKTKFKQTEIGMIPEDWDIVSLREVLSGNIKHGIYKRKEFFSNRGVKILKMGVQYSNRKIGYQKMEKVEVSEDELIRFRIKEGNLIFSRTSMMTEGAGNCSIVVKHDEPIIFDGNLLCAELNNEVANSDFYFYFFNSKTAKQEISKITTGTQSRNIASSKLMLIPVPKPKIQEQFAIAKILSDLDSKIELNQQMNKTLEAIGQAIFKHWFVDFEFPNEEGKPYRSSGGEMVYNEELGREIPKGWEVRKLNEISVNFDSKRIPLSSKDRQSRRGSFRYYGATGILDYVDDFIFDGTYVLMGEDGSVIDESGFPILQYVWGKFWTNNHAHVLQGKNISNELLYLYLKNTNVNHIVTGAVQPKINQNNMNNLKFALPEPKVLSKIEQTLIILFEKIKLNFDNKNNLTKIRDALLPKLMSGKIRVPVEV